VNAAQPQVRVVRGNPDDVEVAALVAGLFAVASQTGPDDVARPSGWTDRGRRLQGPTGQHHGPGAWRWSMHP
jgi:hypothetical protein